MGPTHYRSPMRNQFHEELDAVGATLVQMAGLVKTAMESATTSLLNSRFSTC
jgi:phosphate transport system protein